MRRRNFLAVGSGLTATSNRWIERRLLLGQAAPEILTQDLSNPEEEFVDDEHSDLDRSSGTLAIDSETGVLRFGSDGNDETVTAIGGYLAADALVPDGTWDGTIDAEDNRIGTDVVDNVKALAFTPESFEGIALRATEAIDLYVDGVLVAGDVALVRYATSQGVFEVEPVRTAIDDTWPQFQFDTANTGTPQPPEAPPTTNLDEKWHVEFGAIGGSSPAVTDGTVYIGTVDPDGVFALNAETGDVQWDFQTEANVEGAPAVADNTVYVGSLDGNVYALATDSEEERWHFETTDEVHSSPAIAHDTIYVGSDDGHVYALDATGDEHWSYETDDAVRSSPAVVNDTVYVGSNDGYVYALDAESGEDRWVEEVNREVFSSPTVVDTTVFIGSIGAENEGAVSALDTESGEEQWRFETDEVWNSPAVVDDTVYVGSNDGRVYALEADPDSGEEVWRFETDGAVRSSPAVVDDTVYVGSDDGHVYALDAISGDERGRFEPGPRVVGSPAIADDTVYVASGSTTVGNVYAIVEDEADEPTVEVEWSNTYGGDEGDWATAVIETSDGGYLVAGGVSFTEEGGDAWIVKLDADGTEQWSNTYGGDEEDWVTSVIETSDDGYLLAGVTSFTDEGGNVRIMKLDVDGTEQWSELFGGDDSDLAGSVIETSDGGYLFAGYTTSFTDEVMNAWAVKLDTDGTEQWSNTYGGDLADTAASIIETSDGGYLFVGNTTSSVDGFTDAWIVKLGADGTEEWSETFGGDLGDRAYSVIETSDGGYLFAGETESFADGGEDTEDAWVVKLNPEGTEEWSETFGGDEENWALSVIETSDGGYLFAGGTTSSTDEGWNTWVVKLDVDGTEQWSDTYGRNRNDWALSVIETSDGGYLFAGIMGSSVRHLPSTGERSDAWVVKLAVDSSAGVSNAAANSIT